MYHKRHNRWRKRHSTWILSIHLPGYVLVQHTCSMYYYQPEA